VCGVPAMQGDLRAELRRQAEAILVHYPGLAHRWEEIPGGIRLAFPTTSANGFEVAVEAQKRGLLVSGHGFHTHFEWQPTAAEAVADALGLVRDLLSPATRVRELRAADRPYRWELQVRDGIGWRTREMTVLTFWNYFGRRSERIYQNETLEPRRPVATATLLTRE